MSHHVASPPDPSAAMLRRLLRQARSGDYLVAGAFVALALASFWVGRMHPQGAGTHAQVLVRNQQIAEIDLRQPGRIAVAGALGEVLLQVSDGRIRVLASSCPNRYCMQQGAINRPHQVLVCVPNALVVIIAAQPKADLDAITF